MGKTANLFGKKARGIRITYLMSRYGSCCHLCGELLDRKVKNPNSPRYITFDHVVPRSLGGLTHLDNLKLAHQICNNTRGCDPLKVEDEDKADET